ncbi:MAG: DEAD/DEAH box helicase [Thermoplasmata archaeon]
MRSYAIEAQIQKRIERAKSERFDIESLHPSETYTLYRIFSHKSRKSYHVEIRDLTERVNRCSCPDYETNSLGTCKHIEAVLLSIRRKPQAKKMERVTIDAKDSSLYPRVRGSAELGEILSPFLTKKGKLRSNMNLERLEKRLKERGAFLVITPRAQSLLDERERIKRWKSRKRELKKLLSNGGANVDLLELPLYPFQHLGALFLATTQRAMLADDMGLGKTVQALAACEFLRRNKGVERILIVCPASLKIQWSREIRRFTGEKASVIGGSKPKRRKLYHSRRAYTVMNYELLLRDVDEVQKLAADIVILDEAQRIKNWRAKTTQLVKELISPYAFVLTGTPLENKLEELYSIVQFLDRKLLGPAWKFLEEHVERNEWGAIVGYRNLEKVRERIAPIFLRRRREEVLDQLPPIVENDYYVPLTPAQRRLYNPMSNELRSIIATASAEERELDRDELVRVLNLIVWMRETCDDSGLLGEVRSSSKVEELGTLMEEITEDEDAKVVVFSEFEKMTAFLESDLNASGFEPLRLHGGMNTKERQRVIDQFTQDPKKRIFISTEAGGLGLNLQAASYVINFELPWNPARVDQRIARVHRMGQERTVNVVNLLSEGTIEERVRDVIHQKKELFAEVVDGETDSISLEKIERMSLLKELIGCSIS